MKLFNFNNTINYVSAPCGHGKTFRACELIKSRYRHEGNVVVALPTIALVREVEERLVDLGLEPLAIHMDEKHGDRSVRAAIVKALKTAPDLGLVLLVTWNALVDLPHFHGRDNWTIFIDEIPSVDTYKSWRLPRNKHFITDKMLVFQTSFDGLSIVTARDLAGLRDQMEDVRDEVDECFRPLYTWLASDNRTVYVETAAWEKFIEPDETSGDESVIGFLSILKPRLFNRTIIMGANFESSLLHHHIKQDTRFRLQKELEISAGLQSESHNLAGRAQIQYVLDKSRFSRTLKKTPVDGKFIIDYMDDEARKLFEGREFLWVRNKDDKSVLSKVKSAIPMPVIAHGMNCYDAYNAIYLSAALNRNPFHCRMMNILGFTSAMMTRATAHEIYYQAIMRTILRRRDSNVFVDVLVPDEGTAREVGAILGVTQITRIASPLQDYGKSLTANQKNQRSKYAKAFKQLLDLKTLPNPLSSKGNSHLFGNSNLQVCVTFHLRRYDKNPEEFHSHMFPVQDFIECMSSASRTVLNAKENTYMFNATTFVMQPDQDGLRRQVNYQHSAFLVLDFDKGSLSPKEFIRLFGRSAPVCDRLSFIICNSFSRSPEKLNRFRVIVFFAQPATSIEQHQSVYEFMVQKLSKARLDAVANGLDQVSKNPVHSFYMPCTNRKFPEHAIFECHNTKTREINKYGLDPDFLQALVEAQRAEALEEVEGADFATEADFPPELIDQAIATVRSLSSGKNHEFFMTGVRLRGLRHNGKRLSTESIEGILNQIAGSDREMKRKVAGIMKSLRRYGLI